MKIYLKPDLKSIFAGQIKWTTIQTGFNLQYILNTISSSLGIFHY